jgi:glucose-6-phosphate 1-dehydrogenase
MMDFLGRGILDGMNNTAQLAVPTSLVLLGATGDLAQKKLLQSLFDLYVENLLPEHFHIVAFSKDDLSNEAYRAFARKYIQTTDEAGASRLESFLNSIEYVQGLFDEQESFAHIRDVLERYDASIGMCTSKLFYLAVPPVFYETIFSQIAAVRLEVPCVVGEGWTRILVEKPFGSDLAHAQHLESLLSQLFREEQVYRIDHYLAKDALQNIIAFKFSNGIFENNWTKEFVEGVYIRVYESFDIGERGAFFDGVGALRDVGQNHMLQMLALIAMRTPKTLDAEGLRAARAEVLEALELPRRGEEGSSMVKGQYDGYRSAAHVDVHSKTETYFALKATLNLPEWEGVPFYLEHGKALEENRTDITVRFRSSKNCVCGEASPHNHPNFVRFTIGPDQRITVRFWVRKPGSKYELEPNDLIFDRHKTLPNGARIKDAYADVLFDGLCGDQTLFVSTREQHAAWTYVTSILKLWDGQEPLVYERGTMGPVNPLITEVNNCMRLAT